jgi:hypothetical protein
VGLYLERMKVDLPYIREDRDRHGNWRIYVRRKIPWGVLTGSRPLLQRREAALGGTKSKAHYLVSNGLPRLRTCLM